MEVGVIGVEELRKEGGGWLLQIIGWDRIWWWMGVRDMVG